MDDLPEPETPVNNSDLAFGNAQRDVLEIILARTANHQYIPETWFPLGLIFMRAE